MTLFVPALLACLGADCTVLSAEKLVPTEAECRQIVITQILPEVPKNPEIQLLGMCVPVKLTKT